MTDDLIQLGGILLGCFAGGYAGGFIVYVMRRFFDQV